MLSNKALSAAGGALPTFVSSSSNVASSATSVIVTAPSGIQNGDLLVAVTFSPSAGGLVTPPAGFSQIVASYSATQNATISTKTASSESGNYTFTQASAANFRCTILVYRNATQVNTVGSISRVSSATAVASEITPTFKGTLLAIFTTGSGSATISTAPAGMTQRAYDTTTISTAVYELSPQLATATGDKTIVFSASANTTAYQLQITNESTVAPEFVASASTQRSSGGTTLTISKPAGTVQGDLMVAFMSADIDTDVWSGDTDWVEVADQNAGRSLRIAYKVAGPSEGSSYVFTFGTIDILAGCILTYRYAAYDTVGSFDTGADPLDLPSISPSESQSILLAFGARSAASITLGTPTSMTARVTDNNSTSPSYKVCDQTVAKGPTGRRSMSTGSTTAVAGIMLSIKPTRALS